MRTVRGARAGFTLVELLISGSFLASLLLVAGLATDRTLSSFRAKRAEQETAVEADRLLRRIASELAFATRAGLGPATLAAIGSERIEYRVAVGGGAFGPTRSLGLELESGESHNGVDDDGDGRIDEQCVVWSEDEGGAGERRVVLGGGLSEYLGGEDANGLDDNANGLRDERGLSFVLDGNAVRVRLTLLFVVPDGTVRARNFETTVFPRN